MSYAQEREKLQKFVVTVKYLQLVFFSVLFYGVAMLSYEGVQMIPGIAFSPWSIGCTIFGVEGILASFLIVRSTEKKIEKLFQKDESENEK